MAFLRGGNPAFNEQTYEGLPQVAGGEGMTVGGTIRKTALLLATSFVTAAWAWWKLSSLNNPAPMQTGMFIAIGVAFIISMILVFRKQLAPWLAPLYAAAQGVAMGVISAYFESVYPGIVSQAMLLTFLIFAVMLTLYQTRIIRVTQRFRAILTTAIAAVMVYYLLAWVLSYFRIEVPFLHSNGIAGIVFSLIVVVLASLSFLLDFDLIEQGAEQGAPVWMEWYAAFGLLVTLIWLYLEILRLLSKLNSRD